MNIKDIAFWLMICVVISLCVHLIMLTKQEAFNCLSSPLTYGVAHLTTTNNADIKCSCGFSGSTSSLLFDKDEMKIQETVSIFIEQVNYTYDFSKYLTNLSIK